jgi:hypothetical protein
MKTVKNKLPESDLDSAIRALISRHGEEVVREAVSKATKKKRGRKPERDWPLLAENMRLDAIDWLEGLDPFKLRSNYAVAKDFAKLHPGHNEIATKERIEHKLSKKRQRYMLIRATEIARKEYPYTEYLRAVEAMLKHDTPFETWHKPLEWDRKSVEDYRELIGDPDPSMTFHAIEAELAENQPKMMSLGSIMVHPKGLIGSLPKSVPNKSK